jgi:hypothetical protein
MPSGVFQRKLRHLADRLAEKTIHSDGCHVWTGARVPRGYGYINDVSGGRKKALRVHRVAWELVNGPIPEGLSVLHACDNRLCVNPAHLSLGTAADNTADMIAKGRMAVGERRTHKLTEEDVYNIRWLRGVLFQKEIAAIFGVHPQTIDRIQNGRRWKHVS